MHLLDINVLLALAVKNESGFATLDKKIEPGLIRGGTGAYRVLP